MKFEGPSFAFGCFIGLIVLLAWAEAKQNTNPAPTPAKTACESKGGKWVSMELEDAILYYCDSPADYYSDKELNPTLNTPTNRVQ